MTPACSLNKETVLAFFAHSSFLSEHMTSSFDWRQGKYTCHSKEILFISHYLTRVSLIISRHFDNKTQVDHFKVEETEIYRQ